MTSDSLPHEPRILVVRLSSLGDIVHTLPALAALRQACPNARIDWVVEDRFADTLGIVPEIETVHALSRRDGAAVRWRAMRRLAAHRYDLAIDFQGLFKSALVAKVAGIPKRIGFARGHCRELAWLLYTERVTPPGDCRNIVSRNLELAEAAVRELGGSDHGTSNRDAALADVVQVPGPVLSGIDDRLRRLGIETDRYAVLNPGARWTTKRWPVASYVSLAKRLQEELGLAIVVTAFGNERSLGNSIRDGLDGAAHVLDDLSVREHAAICARAAVVIGSDTGPVHLAHAVDTPVVWLFGPTTSSRNAPPGRHGTALQSPLECTGCWKRSCPLYDSPRCMEALDVDSAFEAARARVGP